MKNIYKRFILFLFLCIPSRFLLAYIASILNKKNLSDKLIDDFNKKYINNLELIFDEKAF